MPGKKIAVMVATKIIRKAESVKKRYKSKTVEPANTLANLLQEYRILLSINKIAIEVIKKAMNDTTSRRSRMFPNFLKKKR